ncbi:MAG: YCF48-related protein [Patescibacteria group bacterium]
MRQIKKVFFLAILTLVVVATSGCTISLGSSKSKGADGGVWKSLDGGKKWVQSVSVPTITGKPASIANVDVRRMIFDPQDSNTIYLATEANGVIYTYDGGNNWRQFKDFRSGQIRSIAVDTKYKCTLYLLTENKLYKSNDCGRFWKNIYFHQNQQVTLNDISVSFDDNNVLYLATSAGEVIKSADGGQTWATVFRPEKGTAVFVDLLIDPGDSNKIYAASTKKGIFKTSDGGSNWESLGEGLKSYTGSHDYKALISDPVTPESLILISKYGMLRSRDGGQSWEIINLLPSSKATTIYSVAVNPKNSNEIYYSTRTSLVKSIDGGQTWSSQKLPFSRVANQIIIDWENPQVVYLGALLVKD